MGNYNTAISKRAQNANNIIISTLSSTTSKTIIDNNNNNNNNDNYEFINDPSLNDYDNSHYNSDNNIMSNVNNMKTSLINSAKIKLQDTLNDIATTATNLNNKQNNNYNSDNNNNNNELIFDSSDIDTTIKDSIYMKPITTTITTIIDTHHNNLVGGNSGLLQKLGRGLSSNEVNMIRNHVTSHHGSNGNTFTSAQNTNTLLNDYGSNSLNSAMINIQNHDNLMKQMEYDKFMNEIWIGIVLTLIVISLVFCICSCFLYHQFRQWKRNYRQNCQRNYDIESVKLNVEDDDPVPNYTLVSGLPSYEAALELLRNSTSTTTSPTSLSTTRLLPSPSSSGSNCINSSDITVATATTAPTILLPSPPYSPPINIIGTQSTSPPSIFHVFGTINNDNQNNNINSNSNSNINSNNNNNDNTNNLKELSNSCEKIVIPIIHRSSDNHHQQQHLHHQQQQQQQLQCQQQDDTNTTEIINYEDYQTSEKNFIKSNEICNNINLSDELNSDTKTHH